MGHAKDDTVRVYLSAKRRERLDSLKKSGLIRNFSAFVGEKIDEKYGAVDPAEKLKEIAEQRKVLDESEKVWLQCVHTKVERFDRLREILKAYDNLQKPRYTKTGVIKPTPKQLEGWVAKNDDLTEILGDLAASERVRILERLRALPNLTQAEAEEIIGGPL